MNRPLLCAAVLLAALLPWASAQDGDRFQPSAGRFQPAENAQWLLCLDTWTGRLHATPRGSELDGEALVIDLPEARMWKRKLARDVSGGHVLEHSLPAGRGAGQPVFSWSPDGDVPGVLDTRSGVHYAVSGPLGTEATIVRTDLRLLTRSTQPVKHISQLREGR